MLKRNCLVGEAWHDLPSRQPKHHDSEKTLSLATSASDSFWYDPLPNEVNSSTALHRMLMMTGKTGKRHPQTSSMPGRQLMMSERTCCSPCAGMATIHRMVLPWWVQRMGWARMLGRCGSASGWGSRLPLHTVHGGLLKMYNKSQGYE